jgi:hypothetical protein
MNPVAAADVFFRRGDELIILPCSHEICFCNERLLQLAPGADPCAFLKQHHMAFHTENCLIHFFSRLKVCRMSTNNVITANLYF